MSSRRQMLEFISLSRLPSAYQEVEYIESTGTQWINTYFAPTNQTILKINISITSSSTAGSIGTLDDDGSNRFMFLYNTTNQLRGYIGNSGWIDSSISYQLDTFYSIELNVIDATFVVNGSVAQGIYTSTIDGLQNIYLFARNQEGSVLSLCNCKISKCQIYDNNILVRDFVPCYRKADSVIGLYDLVNGVFYTNAGTGTFTKGADV